MDIQQLRRVDYAQVGTTSPRCLCVIRSEEPNVSVKSEGKKTKQQFDQVIVGAQNGVLFGMEMRQGGDATVVFKTPPGPQINCIRLGGALNTTQDKTFVAVSSQVRGFSRKGKQFLAFDCNTTEPIISLFVYGVDMLTSSRTSLNHYHDCVEVSFYTCSDAINDILCLPVAEGGWVGRGITPVIACADKTIKVLDSGRLAYEIPLDETPNTLHLWMNDGGLDKQRVLYGTTNGRLGLVDVGQTQGRVCFEIETRTYASIVAIDCYPIIESSERPNIIIGKEDGTIEIFTVDEFTETPIYTQHYQCDESVTGLACGKVTSRQHGEIVVSTYTGWIFVLSCSGSSNAGELGHLNEAVSGAAPQLEVKVQQLKSELEALEIQVRDERERFISVTKADDKLAQNRHREQMVPTFTIHDKFELRKEHACYALLIELSVPIDYILLQSDAKLDLQDVERNSSVISITDAEPESGNALLAVYRCQADTIRVDLQMRVIEGQFGTLRAYIVPRLLPVTCQIRSYPIKPLALHERVHRFDDNLRPINSLSLTGTFSQAEAHSWLVLCIPQLPDRCPAGSEEGMTFNFRSTIVGTVLQAKYRKNEVIFSSDNLSTIVILRDVISKVISMRQLKVHIGCDVKPESFAHMLRLLSPELEAVVELRRKFEMAKGVKELVATFKVEVADLLDAELKQTLTQYEALEGKLRTQPAHLDRICAMVMSLYADKSKMLGRNPTSKLGDLYNFLHSEDYSLDMLIDFFETDS